MKKNQSMHLLSLGLVLIAFWFVLSGHFSLLMNSLALISVFLVIFTVSRMDIIDHETIPTHLFLRLPSFLAWLFRDLVVSNIIVIKNIWRYQLEVKPCMLAYQFKHDSDFSTMIFANSITLTPGTVTIDLEGSVLTIHSLTGDACENIRSGEKELKVRQLVD